MTRFPERTDSGFAAHRLVLATLSLNIFGAFLSAATGVLLARFARFLGAPEYGTFPYLLALAAIDHLQNIIRNAAALTQIFG